MTELTKLDLSAYAVTDQFFGAPYIDTDEWREEPTPHRFVHGGFEETDTRFALCYPPSERYQSRLFQPLQGGNAGDENVNYNFHGALVTGGLDMIFRLGGFAVESNMGHIGDVLDARAGEDPTIYGWRAAAESARFSKFLAAQIHGEAPRHSYVYEGSGGARRSPLCLAYAPDVWDGAVPYMGDAMDGDYGDFSSPRQGAGNFATMFNVQRLLGPRIYDVIDATSPGGSGDPFAALSVHERDELALLYRLGFPRGDEFMIAQPMGQIWLWSSMAQWMTRQDPYFEAFWTERGHVGHDHPDLVTGDLIDRRVVLKRVLSGQDVMDEPALAAPEHDSFKALVAGVMLGTGLGFSLPCVIEVEGLGSGHRLGATIRITSGAGEGRELYCIGAAGDFLFCNSSGETSNLRFTDVLAGDDAHIDNHDFLAYCYYARHHLHDGPEYSSLRIGGEPIHKQYEQPEMSPFMGTRHTGKFPGKMIWVQNTYDSSCWPAHGVGMLHNVEREVGAEEGRRHFRVRWAHNAEHVPPVLAAAPPGRANNTWLIDYVPIVEQTLADLAGWVEQDIEPTDMQFDLTDGQITLAPTAAERGGIQPVVSVRANGGSRAEVAVGEAVILDVTAEVQPANGTIISVRWDFDGSGTYPEHSEVDGSSSLVERSITHTFDRPGTYFATALVEAHRDGTVDATSRRIPNLASARVVVT